MTNSTGFNRFDRLVDTPDMRADTDDIERLRALLAAEDTESTEVMEPDRMSTLSRIAIGVSVATAGVIAAAVYVYQTTELTGPGVDDLHSEPTASHSASLAPQSEHTEQPAPTIAPPSVIGESVETASPTDLPVVAPVDQPPQETASPQPVIPSHGPLPNIHHHNPGQHHSNHNGGKHHHHGHHQQFEVERNGGA